jgi:hypothetical protein
MSISVRILFVSLLLATVACATRVADPGRPTSDGEAVVDVSDGRAIVRARQMARLAILRRLGAVAGFEVVAGGAKRETISVDIEKATLEEAVREIAHGDPYWLSYEHDAERGYHLKWVVIGKTGLKRHVMQQGRNKMRSRIEKRRGGEAADKRAQRITNMLDKKMPEEEDPADPFASERAEAETAAKAEKAANAAKAARAEKKAKAEAERAARKAKQAESAGP